MNDIRKNVFLCVFNLTKSEKTCKGKSINKLFLLSKLTDFQIVVHSERLETCGDMSSFIQQNVSNPDDSTVSDLNNANWLKKAQLRFFFFILIRKVIENILLLKFSLQFVKKMVLILK